MSNKLHPNEVILTKEMIIKWYDEGVNLAPKYVAALEEQYFRQTGEKLNAASS